MAEAYISDIVKAGDLKPGTFNLIDAGCGSGKTYFCINHIFDVIPDLSPSEVVVITSRSITATQMEQNDGVPVTRVTAKEFGNDGISAMVDKGITVMTYDAAAAYLMMSNSGTSNNRVKVIVVDECHTLFVDKFIHDMGYIIAILNIMIKMTNVIVVGLTATADIVRQYGNDAFQSVTDVCSKISTRYPAEQLTLTRMKYLPDLLKRMHGKTIIIVPYAKHAVYLNNLIDNSAIVVSKSRSSKASDIPYEQYMDEIRNCIIHNRTLPDTITSRNRITNTYETHRLDVLIATTTFREGFNLDEISGVENVVCCFTDDIHITQFLGRCRYVVKNLIIAPPDRMSFSHQYASYFSEYCKLYNESFAGVSRDWMYKLKDLYQCDVDDVRVFTCDLQKHIAYDFIDSIRDYTDGHWLYADDLKVIIDNAKFWNALKGVRKSHYTKSKVLGYLSEIGYDVSVESDKNRNSRVRYKIIKRIDITT